MSKVILLLMAMTASFAVLHAQENKSALSEGSARMGSETRSLGGEVKIAVRPADRAFFNGPDADHLLGDWHGWRSNLQENGVQFTGYWTGIASGNPVGGAKVGHTTTVDDTFIVANFDLDRIAHWRHAGLQMSFIDRGGRGLTNEYIGGQYNVQQCVGGQSPFFYQMFFTQAYRDGKYVWKAGRLSASDDMNMSPFYSLYLNNGFNGDIRNILFDTQSSAYPFPTWGGFLRTGISKNTYLKSAVYQTTAKVFDPSKHGLDWAIHDGDGIIYMQEAAWTPSWKMGHEKDKKSLDGHYWLGATYSPWKGYTQFLRPEKVSNSYGFYVHGDQMIHRSYEGSKANIALWAAAAYYPQQNISIVPLQINVGLVDQGRFRTRPDDKTILGFIYGQFSRDYAKSIVAAGKGNPNHEIVVEIAHRIQLARHTFIEPDLQLDLRPAGTGRIASAVVPGVEIGITF